MLAGAGFGDNALLAHALYEKSLAEAIINFVRASVEQVFALQVDSRAAEVLGESGSKLERRGASGEIMEEVIELRRKFRVALGGLVGEREFFDGRH
jgi:hypothetical protein